MTTIEHEHPTTATSWSLYDTSIFSALDSWHSFASRSAMVPRSVVPDTSAISRPGEPGYVVLGLGSRRFADGLPTRRSKRGKSLPYIVGHRELRGDYSAYLDFCLSHQLALGSAYLVNLLTQETPDTYGATTRPDVHLATAVGPWSHIVVVRPDGSAAPRMSARVRQWDEYLGRAGTKRLTIRIDHGLTRRNAAFDLLQRGMARCYGSYGRFIRRTIDRFQRQHPGAAVLVARCVTLRSTLWVLRQTADNVCPSRLADSVTKYAIRIAKDYCQDVAATDLRTALDADPSAALAYLQQSRPWEYDQVMHDARVRASKASRSRVETAELSRQLLALLPDSFNTTINQEAMDASVALEAKLGQASIEEHAGLIESTLNQYLEELRGVYDQICKLRPPRFDQETFEAKSQTFQQRAMDRMEFAPLYLDFWEVGAGFLNPATGERVPLDRGFGPASNTAQLDMGAENVPVVGWENNGFVLANSPRVRELLTRRGTGWNVFLPCDIPNLDRIPVLSDEMYDRGAITIDQKLVAHVPASCEAFLICDRLQRAYSPALARPTSVPRALLDRPTLIAQGPEFIAKQFEAFGYEVEIPPVVMNRLGTLAARSRRNSIPLRPVEAFEAAAFFEAGRMKAQASLWHPNGTPIWIAGRKYTITPGWTRVEYVVSEDEVDGTEQALRESGAEPEREVIDVGIQQWTVESEIGPIIISEDKTREEVEMTASALRYPDLAADVLGEAIKTPSNAAAATDVGGTGIGDEDFALLQAVRFALNSERATAGGKPEARTPQRRSWPDWRPFFDDFITVFPPPCPDCVSVAHRAEIESLMTKIAERFGSRYQRPVDGDLPTIPHEVDDRAFQLWMAERCAAEPPAVELFAAG